VLKSDNGKNWSDDGEYKVVEASLVIEQRAIPLYCRAVHKDEYALATVVRGHGDAA
jgi:hypothetical protein